MKRHWKRGFLPVSLCFLLVLSASCSRLSAPTLFSNGSSSQSGSAYITVEGHTHILTEATELKSPYSYLYDADVPLEWCFLEKDSLMLEKGDIVLVLREADGISTVLLPYGDPPPTYGYVESDYLSDDPAQLSSGNQAFVEGPGYNAPNGSAITELQSQVNIVAREGNWAKVDRPAGAEQCWVPVDCLEFNFDEDSCFLPTISMIKDSKAFSTDNR